MVNRSCVPGHDPDPSFSLIISFFLHFIFLFPSCLKFNIKQKGAQIKCTAQRVYYQHHRIPLLLGPYYYLSPLPKDKYYPYF